MASFELIMPRMGEGVAEATIIRWLKKEGEKVDIDEALVEVATDKVDSEVPSPVAGILSKQLIDEDQVVKVGEVVAYIEIEASEAPMSSFSPFSSFSQNESDMGLGTILSKQASPEAMFPKDWHTATPPAASSRQREEEGVDAGHADRFYSPLVKSIARSEGLNQAELSQVKGTGAEGRVTKQDVIDYISTRIQSKAVEKEAFTPEEAKTLDPEHSIPLMADDEVMEMGRMRRLIADHMMSSQSTSAHVTSFAQADVSNMVAWRARIKEAFQKREQQTITFTPIFIEAVARSIRDFPMINVSVQGRQLIKHAHINIGMATNLPDGNLIVPVIKDADQKNLIGLTKRVNDLAKRARENKLLPEEVKEGTFTLTNIGVFGNLMGTPIINQPQVAILAVGAITKKPSVMETEFGDVIAIRHKMYLSLSYDHRVVDGALGGKFLQRIVEYLEAFDLHREL